MSLWFSASFAKYADRDEEPNKAWEKSLLKGHRSMCPLAVDRPDRNLNP